MSRAIALLIAATLAVFPLSAHAATRAWPGPSPCHDTLQACLDGAANGDRIEILVETPIDENIVLLDRSLTLTAPAPVRARFATGRWIDVGSTASAGNMAFSLSRIRFLDGFVRLRYAGTGVGTFDVRHLDLERSATGTWSLIHVSADSGATVNATVSENRVAGVPAGPNSGLIELSAGAGTLNAYAAYNRLSRNTPASENGAGIFIDAFSLVGKPAAGTVRLFANEIRGNFDRGAIFVSEGLAASSASHFSALTYNNVIVCADGFSRGIAFTAGDGTIAAQAVNNTITGCHNGISALRWSGGSPDARISGVIGNNLVRATSRGLLFTADLTPDLSNDYNLINAPANIATLGEHTITADARLVSPNAPRLRGDSPARDAADGSLLANGLIDAGLPALDADGLRRVKGGGADVGAYESGDVSTLHIASPRNTSGHITRIDHSAGNDQPSAFILPTRIYGPAGPRSIEPFGVYYQPSSSRWTIYNEALTPLSGNLRFGTFIPGNGGGAFIHAGNVGNTTGWQTQIDNGATNGYADRIVLIAHNWTAASTYNAHLTGIYWTGSGSGGRWHVANLDQANLPVPNAFNVYAQTASPNAFRIAAAPGTRRVEIDHPLVNDVGCVTIHATRVVSPANPGPVGSFDLDFNSSTGRWAIYSVNDFPAGTAFNVLIDPAQVFACTDSIFDDDFEW